ncbi:ABC transporter permease [Halostella litorea]|uniref:ABC transporter permease n=1 Tax=Halostella litorea TaxID=2528831 RepID=UPI001091D44B|nr:ABC transporter permease [Halostella litorea]
MSDPRLAVARRELAALKSEKTIVLALAIQLFIAAFSSFLVVGLVSLYDPGNVEGYNPSVGVAGNASDDLGAAIDEVGGVTAVEYDAAGEAGTAFADGRVDATLVANRTANGTVRVTATVPEENLRTTVLVVKLRDVLEQLERTERDRLSHRLERQPLDLPGRVAASPYFGFTYTVLVPLLVFLPVFISGSVAVDSLTEEVQQGTLELLRVAPLTLRDIVDGKLVAAAGLAPAQVALWLGLLAFNGTRIAHPAALVGVAAGFSLAVVAVGLGIALLAPDRRQAQLLYSSGILLVFTAATLLPAAPPNVVAKLAIGSATTLSWVAAAGYVALGVVCVAVVRAAVGRANPESL